MGISNAASKILFFFQVFYYEMPVFQLTPCISMITSLVKSHHCGCYWCIDCMKESTKKCSSISKKLMICFLIKQIQSINSFSEYSN